MAKALDKRVSVGSNLMDLSKLYDCLPHGQLNFSLNVKFKIFKVCLTILGHYALKD